MFFDSEKVAAFQNVGADGAIILDLSWPWKKPNMLLGFVVILGATLFAKSSLTS